MHRIDTDNARPDANGTGKAGYHLNNDLVGVDPTTLDPAALNAIQEEICTVIEEAEIELEKGTNNQLFTALQSLFAGIGGNSSKLFNVANGVDDTHAVNKLQLDNSILALAISLAAEITNRENAVNALTLGFEQGADFFKLPNFMGGWKFKFGTTIVSDISPHLAHTTLIDGFTEISTVFVGGVDNHAGGVGFTVHRKFFDNNGVTVKFDEFSSGTQNCGYWWLAIGK